MIVFDLDGTLSIVGDRLKYLQQEPKDWDAFYEACGEDKVNIPIAMVYSRLYYTWDSGVCIVTGRREICRDDTIMWLMDNGLPFDSGRLHMRANGDLRHDTIVKPELVRRFVDEVDMVFEDRNSMVAKWRELGLTCCQVAEGDF